MSRRELELSTPSLPRLYMRNPPCFSSPPSHPPIPAPPLFGPPICLCPHHTHTCRLPRLRALPRDFVGPLNVERTRCRPLPRVLRDTAGRRRSHAGRLLVNAHARPALHVRQHGPDSSASGDGGGSRGSGGGGLPADLLPLNHARRDASSWARPAGRSHCLCHQRRGSGA